MAIREVDSTTRVYIREWTFERRCLTKGAAMDYAIITFDGRLLPGDLKVVKDELDETWVVWVRRPNVNSEWKRPVYAAAWKDALVEDGVAIPADIVQVTRNSKAEHQLLQYGVLKVS